MRIRNSYFCSFITTSCGSTLVSNFEIKYTGNQKLSLKVNEKPTFEGTFSILQDGKDKTSECNLVLPQNIGNNLKIISNRLVVEKAWTQNYNADFYVKAVDKQTNATLAYLDGFTIDVTGGDSQKSIIVSSSIMGRIGNYSESTAVNDWAVTPTIIAVNTIGLPDDAELIWHITPEGITTQQTFLDWLVDGKIYIEENNGLFSLKFKFLQTSTGTTEGEAGQTLYFQIYCENKSTQIVSNKIHGLSINIYC